MITCISQRSFAQAIETDRIESLHERDDKEIIQFVKDEFNTLNLTQRCTLLEQIALKKSDEIVLVAFSDKITNEILMHKSKDETLSPLHVVSVLDSMLKLDAVHLSTESGSSQRVKNWMIIESIMGRSQSFFDMIEDAALIAMLIKRLHQSRNNLDVDELFEKAEIKLL